MQTEERDGSVERRILIALVTDRVVLARVASKWNWDGGLFASKWSNLVAGWCVRYSCKYGKSPGADIRGIYEAWASKRAEPETAQLVERFLVSLSEESEKKTPVNSEWIVDEAGRHFQEVSVRKALTLARGHLDNGDVDEAVRALVLNRVDLGASARVRLNRDKEAYALALSEDQTKPLVTYPGAVGKFFGTTLRRDTFISFEGKEKIGKSFFLLDFGYRAMIQGCKVAHFEMGDLGQPEVLRRMASRHARAPVEPGKILFPTEITKTDNDDNAMARVVYEEMAFTKKLDVEMMWSKLQKTVAERVGDDDTYNLECYPSGTGSIADIRTKIIDWMEQDQWVADVVVIDYADIMGAVDPRQDKLEQINRNWIGMRALSQEFHCLVVTATQTNAASYDARTLSRRHFSGDKRKHAHVSALVGINQTEDEKEKDIYRLNWILRRSSKYSTLRCVHCAGCPALTNPIVVSTF